MAQLFLMMHSLASSQYLASESSFKCNKIQDQCVLNNLLLLCAACCCCPAEIVELLSRVLEHLVSGEVMQMSAAPEQLTNMDYYLDKTFYKTASLMANSARAVAILGEQQQPVCDLAWQYGRHLGLAFQIVDDLLDILGSSKQLGKPALNDLRAGIATAPVLLAVQEQPALIELIRRCVGDGADWVGEGVGGGLRE
jgi:geranylgeranyl pyrophosphate synthase